ncbi:ATP-binding protein [Vibrio algarum]|uniref:histidine kinase n=1 Tax=Vibrio algarum TaxID=3020714 RepID=A0ABT4YR24_9VIBR|nr:transporter substrate-binding domain-containing protein [Vibrio sp. KJ40-1]MDB1124006.1 transporter substrate-binding domain-containing protein [Vibrio sp. KJ40-1]
MWCHLARLLVSLLLISLSANANEPFDSLSNQQKDWLDKKQSLTVVALSNRAPYSYLDNNGELSGLVKDYSALLAQAYNIDIDFLVVDNEQQVRNAIKAGKADFYLFSSTFLKPVPEFSISKAMVPFQLSIISSRPHGVISKVRQLENKKIAIIAGSNDILATPEFATQYNVVGYDTLIDALRALSQGDIDALVTEPISAMDQGQKLGIKGLVSVQPVQKWNRLNAGALINSNNAVLTSIINHFVDTLNYSDKNRLLKKWISPSPYRPSLSGVFSYGLAPYAYSDSTTMGLQYSVIQHILLEMGYQIGQVDTLPTAARQNAIKQDPSIDFVIDLDDAQAAKREFTQSVMKLNYIPVTLAARQLNLNSNGQSLHVSAVLYDDKSIGRNAVTKMTQQLKPASLEFEHDIGNAIEQLKAQTIDVLLIEKRVLEWFVIHSGTVDPSTLQYHPDQSSWFTVPIEFGDDGIRKQFDAAFQYLANDSSRIEDLISINLNKDLREHIKKAKILAYVAGLYVVDKEIGDFTSILNLFDLQSEADYVELYSNSSLPPERSWQVENNQMVMTADKIDARQHTSVTQQIFYRTTNGDRKAGFLKVYFDVNKLLSDHAYFPSLGALDELESDTYNYISKLYQSHGLSGEVLNLNKQEREWLTNNRQVDIGIDPNALPYERLDANGEYSGMINDYLQLIKTKTGLNIDITRVKNWSGTMALADYGLVDLVSAAVENQTLTENYRHTEPLFSSRLAIASTFNHSDLELKNANGMAIGLLTSSANTQSIMTAFPNVNWKLVANTEEGLEKIKAGELVGMIDTLHVLNYLINTLGYNDLKIVNRIDYYVTPSFHVLKNKPILLTILNKAILSISASEHKKIETKWSAPKAIERINYQLVYTIAGFSVFILLLIFAWNRQLKKQINIANEAKKKLEQAQNQLYTILNTSPIAASVIIDGKVIYINETAKRLFQIDDELVADFDVNTIYSDPTARHEMTQRMASDGKIESTELVLKKTDGQIFTALTSYYQLDINGKLANLFWAYDISELKRLNHQLEEAKIEADSANKAKSDFLANMSHEIRTPMNAIIGMSYLAIPEITNKIAKNYVEKVHYSAQSLLTIINDILDLSKIESGHLEFESIPFQLSKPLKDVDQLMQIKAQEKGIEFTTFEDEGCNQLLLGDPLRLFQVILNLVSNAVKFTDQGSVKIFAKVIKSKQDTAEITVSVQDTGIGISQENIEHLFDAFSQADTSTTRKYGGTGLGLNISQKLLNGMGSTMEVSSEHGVGSQFSFCLTLPFANQEQIDLHSEMIKENSKSIQFKGQRLLLVEDNEFNQELAIAMLNKINLHADIASDGSQAVTLASENEYPLVLMDLQMPIMDGYQATNEIRKNDIEIPILAMSANVLSDVKERATLAGMNGFIEKPVELTILAKTLSNWLEFERFESESDPTMQPPSIQETPSVFSLHSANIFTNGDTALLNKLITKFIKNAPTQLESIQQSCLKGALSEGELTAHTLKSMAASIGAQQLSATMQIIETLCASSVNTPKLPEAILTATDQLAQLLPHLDENLISNVETTAVPPQSDTNTISNAELLAIKEKVQTYDGAAITMLDQAIEKNNAHSEKTEKVKNALERYDFEQALSVIDEMLKEH